MLGAAAVLDGHEYLSNLTTVVRIVHEETVHNPDKGNPFVSYTIMTRFEKSRTSEHDSSALLSHYSAIHRRYSDFLWLNGELERTFSDKVLPAMPSKMQISFTSSGKAADARERREQLESYLTSLQNHRMFQASYAYKLFFIDDVDFATKDSALYQNMQPAMDSLGSTEHWLRFRMEDVALARIEREMHRRITNQTQRADEQLEAAKGLTVRDREYGVRKVGQVQRQADVGTRAIVHAERFQREDDRKKHQIESPGLVWVDRAADDECRAEEDQVRTTQKETFATNCSDHGVAEVDLDQCNQVHGHGRAAWNSEIPKWRNDVHDWLLDNVGTALPSNPSGILGRLQDRRTWVKSEHPAEKPRLDKECARYELNQDSISKAEMNVFEESEAIGVETDAWSTEDAALAVEQDTISTERAARASKEKVVTEDLESRESKMAKRTKLQSGRKQNWEARHREQLLWEDQHKQRRERIVDRAAKLAEIVASQEARNTVVAQRLAEEKEGTRVFCWDDRELQEIERSEEQFKLHAGLGVALRDLQQQVGEQESMEVYFKEHHQPATDAMHADQVEHDQGNPRTAHEAHEDCDLVNDPYVKDVHARRATVDGQLESEDVRLKTESDWLEDETRLFGESAVQIDEIKLLLDGQVAAFKQHMEQRAAETLLVREMEALQMLRQKQMTKPVRKAHAHTKAIDRKVAELLELQRQRFELLTNRQVEIPVLVNQNRARSMALQHRESAQGVRLKDMHEVLQLQQSTSVRHWITRYETERETDKNVYQESIAQMKGDIFELAALYAANSQARLTHRHHEGQILELQVELDERLKAAQEHWDTYPHDNDRKGEDVQFLAKVQAELSEVTTLSARAHTTIESAQLQMKEEACELEKEEQVLLDLQATLSEAEAKLNAENSRLFEEDSFVERNDAARKTKEAAIEAAAAARGVELQEHATTLMGHQKALAGATAALPKQGSDTGDREMLMTLEIALADRMVKLERLNVQVVALQLGKRTQDSQAMTRSESEVIGALADSWSDSWKLLSNQEALGQWAADRAEAECSLDEAEQRSQVAHAALFMTVYDSFYCREVQSLQRSLKSCVKGQETVAWKSRR